MSYMTGKFKNWDHEDKKHENKGRKKKKKPEDEIQKKIIEYLKKLGFLVIRINSYVGRDERTGNYIKGYFITNKRSEQSAGAPDLFCWCRYFSFFIEVKSAKGRQTDSQKAFQNVCNELGVNYYLARSENDVKMILKNYTWTKMIKKLISGLFLAKPGICKKTVNDVLEEICK